ncbi:MAG: 6-bladed beta-propeller [Gemmatimonadota bacterium]|nr:6-bladed beta-propeller [Gemmatimonadota bacterium]
MPGSVARALRRLVLPTAAFATLGSCTSHPAGVRFEPTLDHPSLSWPAPPGRARIRYLASISTPSDVGVRPSILRRLMNVFTGAVAPRVRQPYGIAVDSLGRIFVADVVAGGVHRFDPARGEYQFIIASERPAFRSPIGVAVGARGDLYVSDSELGVVIVFRPDGRERRRIRAGLIRPTGLAFDAARGLLWVVDTQGHRLVAFDRDGVERRAFGHRGAGAGEFNFPTNVVVAPDGTLYVTDALNFRVQVFSPDGVFLRQFGRHGDAVGDLARPKGIALDSEGHVYVVEGLYDVVNLFDPEGRTLLSFGSAGRGPGEFWLATGIAIDRQDRVYVGDSHNGRIQVLQYVTEDR